MTNKENDMRYVIRDSDGEEIATTAETDAVGGGMRLTVPREYLAYGVSIYVTNDEPISLPLLVPVTLRAGESYEVAAINLDAAESAG